MPVGIGYKPLQRQQTEFFQLPFNELLAGLSAKQKQYDTAEADIDDLSKLFPQAGYATVQDADLLKQKYTPEISKIEQDLLATGEVNPFKIKNLANRLSSDPLYSKVKRDYELRPVVEKMLIEGKAKGDILDFIDPNTGQVKQMQSQTFDPQHYSFTPYEDPYKEIDDQLNLVEAQIIEKVGAGTWVEPTTGERFIRESGITKKFKDSDTFKNAVKAVSTEYAKGNTPGSRYFIKKYGLDPNLIEETVKTRAIPRYMYQEDKILNIGQQVGEGSGASTTGEEYLEEGETPITPVSKSTGLTLDYFEPYKAGQTIPYSESEKQEIRKKFSNQPTGVGGITPAESEIMKGKQLKSGEEYNDLYKLPEKSKGFVENVLKSIDTSDQMKGVLEKYKNKTLSKEDKEKIYPVLDQALKLAEQESQVNASYKQISEPELKAVNRVFGSEVVPKVKDLGAGLAVNHKFFDKSTGETLTYEDWVKQVKADNDKEELISVVGKFKGDNPFALITGEDRFANGRQIVVGGKEYIMTGPQAYSPKSITANNELRYNKALNKIYNLKFLPLQTVELDLSDGEKGYYTTDGQYVILDKNNNEIIKAPSAETALIQLINK